LGLEAWRVFTYPNGRLDFENLIVVPQAVSRALRLLVAKGIIVRAPQTGNITALRLNPHYSWKGKVRNLRQARQTHLQLIELAEPEKDADACGEPS
jgi:hypothetical protein